MTPDITTVPRIFEDDLSLFARIADLETARILEIGCGAGSLARRFRDAGASVIAVDLPGIAPTKDETDLTFLPGRAEELPVSDSSQSIIVMMKSLHHVPVARMDKALVEINRALNPGGKLIVCEPVAEGAFDEMIRPFHDESLVRAEAQAALDRCRVLTEVDDFRYLVPTRYADVEDFTRRMIESPTVKAPVTPEAREESRALYTRHTSADGSFMENRPFRCRVFVRPKEA